MHPKWRAPACYVGVAVLCVLYLIVVPGVNLITVCAGAGLGAAVMWAINEWETGKWNVPLPIQPALAAAFAPPAPQLAAAGVAVTVSAEAVQAAQVVALQAAPVAPIPVHPAEVAPSPALPDPEPRERVDAGAATPEKMEKWEIDEKEPSWDPTALAETWAKLRAELSINRPSRPAVAPDLPRTAQLARNAASANGGKSARPVTPASAAKPVQSTAAKPASSGTSIAQPAGYTLGSLGKTGGSPLLGRLANSAAANPPPARKVASATPEPARQPSAFLRPSTFRPR